MAKNIDRYKMREYRKCMDCIHFQVCKMRILIQDNNEHNNGSMNTTIWLETSYVIATVCMQYSQKQEGTAQGKEG